MISRAPSLSGIKNAAEFRTAIETARQRSRIRKYILEELYGISKVANMRKLKRHKDWIIWYRAITDYLSTIIGQDRFPLRYVIRESKAPDYTLDSQPNYDFEHLSINCVPLTGLNYKTDARKVHQPIHGFVQGETSKTWINPKEKSQDGLHYYQSLLYLYRGEGNKAVLIKEAEAL